MSEKKNYYPPMHTAEHILNQTMVRFYNCGRAFNAHIESKKSKCDYRFERALTQEELQKIENKVNEIIKLNLPVVEKFINRLEAEKLYDCSKLPDDAGDKIRIIEIGDYDACPCIGPHVNFTAEIGTFKIISSDYENGVLRIRFKLS